MDSPAEWKTTESRIVAECRVFDVREDFSTSTETGEHASFFVIECPDWVNVIPITKEGKVVLIEQYRQGTQEITLEIPAGMISPGEEPIETAERELEEETGFRPGSLVAIGRSRPNPAIQSNWIYHFVALDCEPSGSTDFDEHESIVNRPVLLEDVPNLIEDERISHSLAIAAFHRLSIRGF